MNKLYSPPDATLWQGRTDAQPGEYMFQHVQCVDLSSSSPPNLSSPGRNDRGFAILGFCCDEGIRRNHGRVGAAEGPDAIRKALGRQAAHFSPNLSIVDVGNIVCRNQDLEQAQHALGAVVSQVIAQGYHTVVLGGGHETAWGHYLGLSTNVSDNLGIINIDAHFDLRPLNQYNHGHSGSPFLQIADHRIAHGLKFDYLCLGIQKNGNSHSLFETAHKLGVKYLEAEDFDDKAGMLDIFLAVHDAIYLSVCMDVFGMAFAPGVSAPQALGLVPSHVIPTIQKIMQSQKVMSIDFVEVSPRLDSDNKTSLLAASLVMTYFNAMK